jgi:ubiquinone/menaquinone biosynthesis C-methylase UbiE
MRLDDPTTGLQGTALESIELDGETLEAHRRFWDRSADVDAVRAIASETDEASFATAGLPDAGIVRQLLHPDAVVVELGSGVGRILQHLAGDCREIHGVDISPRMVALGAERLAHLSNVHFHLGNGYDLAMFEDQSVDVVYSHFVLQHVPRTTAFNYAREAARILKPHGAFRLQVPNLLRDDHFAAFAFFAQPHFVDHPYPMYFFTPAEVAHLLVRAGFWVESMNDAMDIVARRTSAPGLDPAVQEVIATSGSLLTNVLTARKLDSNQI